MTSKITYQSDLRTTAKHLRSGNEILTDAPVDNRGKGEAFSPTDLLATSLGSCILTIMGIKAADKEIEMTGATAEINKIMGSNPRRIVRLEITIQMPDNNYTDKEKKLLEAAAHGCPVGKSLHPDLEEIVQINW
jgi:Predicted redox protein, regulator of disulfide bond formation